MKKQVIGGALVVQLVLWASLAWGAVQITSLPYTINSSGSYYISQNLTSTNQNNHDGIIINASNVSIDLRSNALIGNNHTGSGIGLGSQATNIKNIEVINGTITGFGTGVMLYPSEGTRMINLRLTDNLPTSMDTGIGSLIKDCYFAYNGGGPAAGEGSLITGNISHNSGGNGFAGGGPNVTYIGNTVYNNAGEGINSSEGCTLINNTAYGNGQNGFNVGEGSTVKNNTAYGNQEYGINLAGNNLVDGNTAYNNNQSNQGFANFSSCSTCVFGDNLAP